jgi:cytochrome P450
MLVQGSAALRHGLAARSAFDEPKGLAMSGSTLPTELFSSEYYQDPYPTLAWLRENSPLHRFQFPIGDVPMWAVTRYDDVREFLADTRFSSDGGVWASPEFRAAGLVIAGGSALEKGLTVIDPPEHTKVRRLAMSAFTPRRIAQWRETVADIVASALDRYRASSTIDVMAYAGAIPATVMGEILGFPLERHQEIADAVAQAFPTDPTRLADSPLGFAKICDLAQELIAEKRQYPADDLASAFVQARDAGERLSEEELISLIAVMILGGVDTTKASLGNAVLALLDHPDQRQLLIDQPELAATAAEEFLRYDGAVATALMRFAKEEVQFAGSTLPAGATVLAMLIAANRDPEKYPDPDRLDLLRSGPRHVGLGHGLHNCLGAALARLEIEIAVPALFQMYPDLELVIPRDEVQYSHAWVMRRIVRLPVKSGSVPIS